MKAKQIILYLGNQRQDAELIRRSLKSLPSTFRFVHAKNRDEFIRQLDALRPAVILVDYQLEHYDGLSAIRDVRQYHAVTPVIVVAGSISEEAAVQCIKAGAADFVLKSQRAHLVAVIDNILVQWKARQELRESEEKYRSIFTGASEGIVVVDRKGTIQEVNPAFEEFTGIQHKDIVGKGAFFLARKFIHRDDLPRIFTIINDALMGLKVKPFELRYKDKILEISIPQVSNIFGRAAILRDVTEERKTAERIRESEARYRDLVENTNDLICTHDLNGRFRMVNTAFKRMLRYSEKALLTKTVQDVLAPGVKDQFKEYIARIKKDGHATGLMKVQDRYGKVYIWQYDNTLKTDGPEPLVRGIAHDITDTFEANRKLKFSEARYRDLAENSHDLIYLHDLEGRLTWVNQALKPILGFAPRRFVNQNIRNLIQKQYLREWSEYLEKVKTTGAAEGYVRLLRRSGEERILEYKASLQTLPGEKPQVRGIARDVTDQLAYEEELRVREAEFRTLYENANIGLYRTTPDGEILLANPSLVKMLGYKSLAALKQRNLEEEGFEAGYNRAEFKRLAEQEGGLKGLQSVWHRVDGSLITVRENARAIRDIRGKILYYEGTVEDISDWLIAQQEKDRILKHQEAINRLSLALGQGRTLRQLYRITYQHLKKVIDVGALFVSRYDPDEKRIIAEYAVADGQVIDTRELPALPLEKITQGIQSRAILTGEPIQVKDWSAKTKRMLDVYHVKGPGDIQLGSPDPQDPRSVHSGIVSPMKIGGEVMGVLTVQSIKKAAYTNEDKMLVSSLGNVLAVARENVRLLEDVRRRLKEKERAERKLLKIREHLEERVANRTAHLRMTNRELKAQIRERKNVETRLQTTLARMESIIESPRKVVIFSLDRKYRYTGFNRSHRETMKAIWGVDIAIGKSMLTYIKRTGDRKKAKANFDRALKGESFTLVEEYGSAPNRLYYEDLYSPIKGPSGNIIGLTVFQTDVTERVSKDEELKKYREHLEELVRERTASLEAEINARKSAQESLARSHERFRLLFEESPISLWEEDYSGLKAYFAELRQQGVHDLERWFHEHPDEITKCVARIRVLNVNQATLRMYEVQSKDELFVGLDQYGDGAYTANFRKDMVSLFRGELSMVNETEFVTPHGKPLSIIVNRFIPPAYEETWSRVLVAVEDITARKAMESALEASREQYRLLTETAPLAVVGTNETAKITVWNSAAVELFGYSEAEALGAPMFSLITPEKTRDVASKALTTFIKTGKGRLLQGPHELTALRKNGELFPVELSLSAYPMEQGWHITGIMRDLTSQKRDREQIDRLATLVHHSTDFISIADLQGKFHFVNQGGRQLVGLDMDRDVASFTMADFLSESEAREQPRIISEVLKKGSLDYETRLRHLRTGKLIPVLVNCFLLTNAETSEPYAIATVQRDITELKRTRRAVEENLKELQLLQEVNTAILNRESFQSIVETLARSFYRLIKVDLLNFYIFNPGRTRLVNMAQLGSRKEMRNQIKRNMDVQRETFVPRLRPGSRFQMAIENGKGFYTTNRSEIVSLFADFTYTDSVVDHLPEMVRKSKTRVIGALPIMAGDVCLGLVVFNSQWKITPEEYDRIERLVSMVATSLNYQRAEERLRERDERFQSLLNTATDAILGMDEKNTINIWNPAAERLFGFSRSEVMGKSLHDLITLPKYKHQIHQGLERFAQTGEGPLVGKTVEVEGVHKDGSRIPLELSISAYRHRDWWQATGIIRDIRERKRAEAIRECLRRISQRLTIRLAPQQIGPIIAEEFRSIYHYHAFGLYELDWEKQQMYGLYTEDTPEGGSHPVPVTCGAEPYGSMKHKILLEGKSILENRRKKPALNSISPFGFMNRPSMSLMFAPIVWNKQSIGFITVQSYDRGAYGNEDLRVLESVANQVSGAFHRARTEELLLIQQTSIEQSAESVVVTDIHGKIIYTYPAHARISGYSFQEVKGKKPRVFQSGHHSKTFYKDLWKTIKSGRTWRGEFLNKRKNGELYWESASISPVLDRDGTIVRFVAVKADITSQKEALKKLEESEERFRTIINSAPVGIVIHQDGMLVLANPYAVENLGYSQDDELIGRPLQEFIHPDDREDSQERIKRIMTSKRDVISYRTRVLKKDGTVLHTMTHGALTTFNGRPAIVVGIIDISESIRHQEELEAAVIKAQVADRVKTLFLANMSHEIRTPLNSLLGFMEVVESETRTQASPDLIQMFDSIHASGNRIIRTIHQILDASTIDAGAFELHPRDLSLKAVVEQVVRELKLKAKDRNLYLKFTSKVRKDQVHVDLYSIQQAVMNLVDNGLKYTDKGGVTIKITRVREKLALTIRDTGIGMSKKYQRRMWDIFSQESEGYTKKYQGVGLGMALVKRYCSLNNVDIDVFSGKGVGSTFTLTFKRVTRGKNNPQLKKKS
ncbi:MAG: PAS domain S-box protein [Fidelibacterota bacterium]